MSSNQNSEPVRDIRGITVVGLGKLGAPIAACLAANGFDVVGVDTDPAKVDAINRGQPPIYEPGLDDMIRRAGKHLIATTDLATAVRDTDITLVLVPTPSSPDGTFSLRHVLPACRTIGEALRTKRRYHVVSITSTVMPGATDGEIRPLLEAASSKRCGPDFGLCYSPEFVALGSVIHDFLHPDFVLIGESDPAAGDRLESLYRQLYKQTPPPPVSRLNLVNAELAKLAVNTYVTAKITFANMLAGICERLPGGDVDAVTQAMGLDGRIGRKYLRGAVAYGGPCFPRDNIAITTLMRRLDAPSRLAEAVDHANREQTQRLATLVKNQIPRPRNGTVAVLGLAYKPNTDVVEQSPGLLLATALADDGVAVTAYDPAAMDNARRILPSSVQLAPDMTACIADADVVVIVTPWDEFKSLDAAALSRPNHPRGPRVLIDCWRLFKPDRFEPAVRYLALGIGSTPLEETKNKQVA